MRVIGYFVILNFFIYGIISEKIVEITGLDSYECGSYSQMNQQFYFYLNIKATELYTGDYFEMPLKNSQVYRKVICAVNTNYLACNFNTAITPILNEKIFLDKSIDKIGDITIKWADTMQEEIFAGTCAPPFKTRFSMENRDEKINCNSDLRDYKSITVSGHYEPYSKNNSNLRALLSEEKQNSFFVRVDGVHESAIYNMVSDKTMKIYFKGEESISFFRTTIDTDDNIILFDQSFEYDIKKQCLSYFIKFNLLSLFILLIL